MAALAFEAKHGVDHMFEDARAGETAVLGHMTDQHDCRAAFLCESDELAGGRADLADCPWRTLDQVRMHRLNRIDNKQVGRFGKRRENIAHRCRRCESNGRIAETKTLGAKIPACGVSLGLERILVVMEERGMFPPGIAESTPADVMVTIWSEETIGESLKLASELRSNGIRVTVYPEPDRFAKQMKYADAIRVPYVCILGESELAENKVTLKDLRTGEQKLMTPSEVAKRIKP